MSWPRTISFTPKAISSASLHYVINVPATITYRHLYSAPLLFMEADSDMSDNEDEPKVVTPEPSLDLPLPPTELSRLNTPLTDSILGTDSGYTSDNSSILLHQQPIIPTSTSTPSPHPSPRASPTPSTGSSSVSVSSGSVSRTARTRYRHEPYTPVRRSTRRQNYSQKYRLDESLSDEDDSSDEYHPDPSYDSIPSPRVERSPSLVRSAPVTPPMSTASSSRSPRSTGKPKAGKAKAKAKGKPKSPSSSPSRLLKTPPSSSYSSSSSSSSYSSPSRSPKSPKSPKKSKKSKPRLAQFASRAEYEAALDQADSLRCPMCGHVQKNNRVNDLARHISSHGIRFRNPDQLNICTGVEVTERDPSQVKKDGSEPLVLRFKVLWGRTPKSLEVDGRSGRYLLGGAGRSIRVRTR
ncbi:hypothetical protein HGRIS_006209 [Hohenbuehelia grisea]|uniref:Uncharacterized protein n=1 Tax=Hohenbuehelia grisea TaxID=104357 RepID=A0ABR3JZM9_9AGAR